MSFSFGDRVENKAASETNPIKRGVFIEYRTRKSGPYSTTTYCRYRSENGTFSLTPPENLINLTRGHLP